MDSWEKFNEKSLPPKKDFYSELTLEDITDKDYAHALKIWEVFEIRDMGEYHDLYIQTDTFYLQIYLKNLEINPLKYMDLILLTFILLVD